MLWTMAGPLLSEQWAGAEVVERGRVVHCDGPDDWRAVEPGGACAMLARSNDLVTSTHLRARGFWDAHEAGVLPGLPWQASFGRASGPAPELGVDTDAVLREVLGMTGAEIAALRGGGALG
jgi:crotonobetainyl-CoA:carnitine CoA-transferase CaiB-like acyl-CoA transferase